ncbi:uncharacterized protein LOC114571645 [Perca flavescens]|uniref:uncharacterized protein LOC114571645 n=1 Tax=Perca flavescens TaxID=8167 RepID=UPI00106E919D|nr:uncharacterized protein LOC114571645 [Perca flavescens]
MARLSISGQTELASRSSNISNNGGSTEIKEAKGTGRSRAIEGESVQQTLPWRIPPEAQDKTSTPVRTPRSTKCLKSTTGESRRVKKTLREGLEANPKPFPKRRWEDLESAGIRKPDSLGPERKRRRMDTTARKKSSWVSVHARAFRKKYMSAVCSRAIKEKSVRVKQTLPREVQEQTLKEGLEGKEKPSYKRKWEDFKSAGIRRPDSLGPERKRRRHVWAEGNVVMVAMPKKRTITRRRNMRCCAKPVQDAEEWRHPECSGHKGRGEMTWRGGSKKAKHDVRSCFDERGNTGPKNQSTPLYRLRPFHQRKQYGPRGRRNPQNMRYQGRRQWATPGPMCRPRVKGGPKVSLGKKKVLGMRKTHRPVCHCHFLNQ